MFTDREIFFNTFIQGFGGNVLDNPSASETC